jgi:hypothetical protein
LIVVGLGTHMPWPWALAAQQQRIKRVTISFILLS